MLSRVLPVALSSALLASHVTASPMAPRQAGSPGDNGSCAKMYDICSISVDKNVTDPWSFEECIFGASCFGGQHPVDDFLASIYSTINNGTSDTPPKSLNEPRVASNVFHSISTDGKVITQQNWIDGYYSRLGATSGPYPTNASAVIDYYNRLAEWTGFCAGGIPEKNFRDYYQYSASVSSAGCAPVTPPVISSDATCQKMFTTCINEVDSQVDDIFQHKSCMLGATCFGGQRPVDGFIAAVYGFKNGAGTSPTSVKETRLSQAVFDTISTDGATMSQQNFIDGWYSELTAVGGPYPSNSDLVISYFQRVAGWAGYCQNNVPYSHVADYYQYSSTVSGDSCGF